MQYMIVTHGRLTGGTLLDRAHHARRYAHIRAHGRRGVSRRGVRERLALRLGLDERLALFPALVDVDEVEEDGAERPAAGVHMSVTLSA